MEFYRTAELDVTEEELATAVTLKRMPEFLDSVVAVEMTGENECMATTWWGAFAIRWEEIMGGVRMYMPGCPNCLSWTVTTGLPPEPGQTVIHCVINRTEHDPDFIESLEEFAEDWKEGLEDLFAAKAGTSGDEVSQEQSQPKACGST